MYDILTRLTAILCGFTRPTGGAATGAAPSAPATQARFRATCTLCGWQDHTPDSTREEAATHLAWHAYTCPQQAPGDKCHYCNGYGSQVWDPIEGYPEKCLSCDGTGRLDRLAPAEPVTIPGRIA